MMRILALLLGCLFAISALAEEKSWEGIYQGKIGTSDVTVLLAHPDGIGEDSRYTYKLKPYDLGLALEEDRSALIFIESKKVGARKDELVGKGKALVTGRWTLRMDGADLKGTWSDPAGRKTLPISLSLISKPATEKERFSIGDFYTQLWAKDLRFVATKDQKSFGAIKIGMSKDIIFKLVFPRLTSHPDAERMTKINTLLEAEHRSAVASARQCQEYLPRQTPDEIKSGKAPTAENIFRVSYANAQLLSLTESGSIHCGGAHPNNFTRAMNFDLTASERLFGSELDDAGAAHLSEKHLGRIFKLSSTPDRERFNSYWWDRWMKGASKPKVDDAECEDGFMNDKPIAERSADFHFTPKGLAVQRTDYSHAMSVCLFQSYNPMIIPWAELKPWVRLGQKLLAGEIK